MGLCAFRAVASAVTNLRTFGQRAGESRMDGSLAPPRAAAEYLSSGA
ncbi:hypothetical protein SAMN05216328_12952 [Ensifer sp. YR511]|nr:hypothetical protein SAMN05216328_12952 [Ensifer sp. YR511]